MNISSDGSGTHGAVQRAGHHPGPSRHGQNVRGSQGGQGPAGEPGDVDRPRDGQETHPGGVLHQPRAGPVPGGHPRLLPHRHRASGEPL